MGRGRRRLLTRSGTAGIALSEPDAIKLVPESLANAFREESVGLRPPSLELGVEVRVYAAKQLGRERRGLARADGPHAIGYYNRNNVQTGSARLLGADQVSLLSLAGEVGRALRDLDKVVCSWVLYAPSEYPLGSVHFGQDNSKGGVYGNDGLQIGRVERLDGVLDGRLAAAAAFFGIFSS